MGGFVGAAVTVKVWKHIAKGGDADCWEWRGAKTKAGYGVVSYGTQYDRHTMAAHRAVYMSVHGDIGEGIVIGHSCGNAGCCNPAHLTAGFDRCVNVRPPLARRVKLSDADVRDIRRQFDEGELCSEIGLRFGICESYARRVGMREAKRCVTD